MRSTQRASASTVIDIMTAAKELDVSEKFIRRRIAEGVLKAYRLRGSRVIRIDRADLEALKVRVLVDN